MKKQIYILGGGTFSHVRNHLALSTPAFGNTAIQLFHIFQQKLNGIPGDKDDYEVNLELTKIAHRDSNLVTNDDVSARVDELIEDPNTKVIVFNVALTDFIGEIDGVSSGKYAERLQTKAGSVEMQMTPAKKIIGKIRKNRKDIFVVGFKTTAGESPEVQYKRGLELLKKNSLNLVLANDTVTRNNMIIVPEEASYGQTSDRHEVLCELADMTIARMQNHFTRSTVVEGDPVDWNGDLVPGNLRDVVNHCILQGAYKPVLGKTAGHFAVKVDEDTFLTSARKTDYNDLPNLGLVKVVSKNNDEVIAYGRKPSVGGQSQRQIYREHPEANCIVHFHCPPKEDNFISVRPQWQNECGSHECGKNTSDGLVEVDLGNNHMLKVVYLDNHGPNIVFSKEVPSELIINYIDNHFNLKAKTGGIVLS